MSVELVHPWTGEIDYRYDYIGESEIERRLGAAERAWPAWAAMRSPAPCPQPWSMS